MTTGIRFVGVGIVSTLSYLVLSSVLMALLGVEVKIASALAYVASMGFSYLGHRHFTFNSRGSVAREGWKFVVTHALNLSLSTLLIYVLVDRMGVNRFVGTGSATLLVMACSFLIMQLWVFRHRGAQDGVGRVADSGSD